MVPVHFAGKILLFPWNSLCIFVKNQLNILVWVCFRSDVPGAVARHESEGLGFHAMEPPADFPPKEYSLPRGGGGVGGVSGMFPKSRLSGAPPRPLHLRPQSLPCGLQASPRVSVTSSLTVGIWRRDLWTVGHGITCGTEAGPLRPSKGGASQAGTGAETRGRGSREGLSLPH